jgi:hypothetical protein
MRRRAEGTAAGRLRLLFTGKKQALGSIDSAKILLKIEGRFDGENCVTGQVKPPGAHRTKLGSKVVEHSIMAQIIYPNKKIVSSLIGHIRSMPED